VIGSIVATGAADAARRPVRPIWFFRVSSSLTPAQTVPANGLAPTTAAGQFDALLLRTNQRTAGAKGGCHGIVAPIHSTYPTTKTCTKGPAPAQPPAGLPAAPPPGVNWRLVWRLSLSGLSGPATAAAIHLGQPGVTGPVAIPLCGPCAAVANGVVIVTADQAFALAKGRAYVEVQTARSPQGEIRGQIRTAMSLVKPGF
jgi:hypothetical protein